MRSPSDAAGVTRSATMLLLVLLLSLGLSACKSDEEKIDALLAAGKAYAENDEWPESVIEFRNALKIDPNHAGAHFMLARAFLQLRKGREAMWEFAESVRLDGSNPDARLNLGALSLVAKDFEETHEQALAIVELTPENPNAYTLLGQALEGLGRSDEAEAPYLKAVEIATEHPGVYLQVLGSYYARRGDRIAAEPPLVKYTEIDPSYTSYTALARFLAVDPKRDESAIAVFEQALELAEPSRLAGAYQNIAKLHFTRGRMKEATEVLEGGIVVLEENPNGKIELIYLLSRFKGEVGDDAGATALLETAAGIRPDDVKPHLILARTREQRGELEGALQALDMALEVDPEHLTAKLKKAEMLVQQGYQKDDAEQIAAGSVIIDEVLASEPTNPDALLVSAKIAVTRSDGEKAVKTASAAVDARPDWAQAHFVLGNALVMIGNTSGARAEVARSVELDPSLLDARRVLARLHSSLGEHEYAVEQGRIYLRVHPDDVDTRILVAQSLVQIGRADEAMRETAKIPADRVDEKVLFAQGRLFLAQGKPEEARAALLKANELSPHHPEILRLLLRTEGDMGKLDEAGARIVAAAAANPDNSEFIRLRGTYALRKGDQKTAEKMFERAIELDPENITAYRQLAALYQDSGRLEETRATYQRAIEKRPDSAQLHHFLAVLYEMDGRTAEAIAGYEKAIQLDEGMGESKNNLAYLLAESGDDLDRALDLAQEAKAMMPESPNAADTLGWVLYRRGIHSAAVGYLREAIAGLDEDAPQLAMVHHHLAMAYEANDQKDMAIGALETSLGELNQQEGRILAAGGTWEDPEWSTPAREMLARLKNSG
jgi:tetratricopeptide (TPR) repeat protein